MLVRKAHLGQGVGGHPADQRSCRIDMDQDAVQSGADRLPVADVVPVAAGLEEPVQPASTDVSDEAVVGARAPCRSASRLARTNGAYLAICTL